MCAKTVLLVEVEESVRTLVVEALRDLQCAVLTASDGAEALLQALEWPHPIDLLITNLVVPSVGGRELAWRLAAVHPQLRVLFACDYSHASHVAEGMTLEEAGFIRKPFCIEQFKGAVRDMLHGTRHGDG